MSWKRHRSDDNQTEIVKVYRQLGWHVVITNQVGDGFPDLVVGKQSLTDLVEVKDGSKPPSERKLTPDEQQFHDNWTGRPVRIIESVDDVIRHNEEVVNASNERSGKR